MVFPCSELHRPAGVGIGGVGGYREGETQAGPGGARGSGWNGLGGVWLAHMPTPSGLCFR